MNNQNITRTTEEIEARIKEIMDSGEDFFGVERAHLIGALPWDSAKQFLVSSATEGDHVFATDRETILADAKRYMPFAVEKMQNERGLSASRSIDHYSGLIWLLTDDEKHERYVNTPYGWYGRDQLEVAAEILGFSDYFNDLVAGDE